MTKWPRDNQSELIAFYGTPGADVESQLVDVVPPFKMYYEGKGKPIGQIRFHRRAAPALRAALNEIWEKCGKDQGKVHALGLDTYDGAYNPRKVRGSATKWSNHAFGAAIDINAGENGMYQKGNMPQLAIDAFKRQGARWGGDYHGRKDPMHFEFCDNGEHPVALVAADEDETPAEEAPKSLVKSKIAALGSSIGIGGGGLAINEVTDVLHQAKDAKDQVKDLGLWDMIIHCASNPKLMFLAGVALAGGLVVYFRWKDHGGGK